MFGFVGQMAPDGADEGQYRGKGHGNAALQPARRTDADQVTHNEPEIEAPGMNRGTVNPDTFTRIIITSPKRKKPGVPAVP